MDLGNECNKRNMNEYPIYGDGRWDIKSGTEHVVTHNHCRTEIVNPSKLNPRKVRPCDEPAFGDPDPGSPSVNHRWRTGFYQADS